MISHIHIVLLTIRIIFVVPRNRSSGQILLHIWIVSGICIIYDDGSPVRVVFHWHYIHKNYRWEASSEDSRRGTRTFIFSPCNIIRKEDHLWWEREGYPKATQKYLIPDRLHWVPSSLVAQYLKVVPTTSQLQESTSSATVWDPTHGNSL